MMRAREEGTRARRTTIVSSLIARVSSLVDSAAVFNFGAKKYLVPMPRVRSRERVSNARFEYERILF